MTKQRKFKKLVRARAAKTGESYTEARRQLKEKALCDTPYDECVLPKGHTDDHQKFDGTKWNVARTLKPDTELKGPTPINAPEPIDSMQQEVGVAVGNLEAAWRIGLQHDQPKASTPQGQVGMAVDPEDGRIPAGLDIYDDDAVSAALSAQRKETLKRLAEEQREQSFDSAPDRERLLADVKKLGKLLMKVPETPGSIGYIDQDSFVLMKVEPLPCGHVLRENTEIRQDLKALWGQAGVDGWKKVLEGEREKHLSGRCSEALSELRLVAATNHGPKYPPVTMVLVDSTGRQLFPEEGDFEVLQGIAEK